MYEIFVRGRQYDNLYDEIPFRAQSNMSTTVSGATAPSVAPSDPSGTDPGGSNVSLLRDERNFIANVSQFYDQEALSDVVLVLKKPRLTSVGEPQFPSVGDISAQPKLRFFAHKFVLAKSSDVFRTMLYDEAWTSPEIIETDTEDSGDNNAGTPSPSSSNSSSPGGRRRQLKLQESSECVAVFGIFLRYLYTAEISITVNSAVGILCLADKYNVDSLKALTVSYMIRNSRSPRVNNALSWYSWAKALNLRCLLKQCARTIAWNAAEVLVSPIWLQMDADFVSDVLKSSELVVQKEHDIFTGLKAWLFHESRYIHTRSSVTDDSAESDRERILEVHAERLLPLIRLPQMFVYELYELEADEEIAKTPTINKILAPLLSKAYRFRALCERQAALGVEFATDEFYMPRDYLQLSFENVRMQNTLRFGLQVDVKTYKGAAPCELKDADWKLTYRKQGDNWHIQLYSHESALHGGEARIQVSVLIYNEALKVIQVHREDSTTIVRGNSFTLDMAIQEPDLARQIGIILKPVPA